MIFGLIKDNNKIKRSEIQKILWIDHAQKVVHRINRLEKKGYLKKTENWYDVFDNPIPSIIKLWVYSECNFIKKWLNWLKKYPREKMSISSSFLNIGSDYEKYFFIKDFPKGNYLLIYKTQKIKSWQVIIISDYSSLKIVKVYKMPNITIWIDDDHNVFDLRVFKIIWVLKNVIKKV